MNRRKLKSLTSLLLALVTVFSLAFAGTGPISASQGGRMENPHTLYTQEQLEAFTAINRSMRASGLIGFTDEYSLDGKDGNVSVIVEFVHQPPLIQQAEADILGEDMPSLKEAERLAESDHVQFQEEINSLFGVNPFSRSAVGADYEITSEFSDALNGVAVTLPADKVAELAELDSVWAVYPNAILSVDPVTESPDGETDAAGMSASRDYLNIDAMREDGLTGKGVTVGVIDTGVDYNHPDLKGAFSDTIKDGSDMKPINGIYYGRNFIDRRDHAFSQYNLVLPNRENYDFDPMETTYSDWRAADSSGIFKYDEFCTAHGTHVSGTVAGRGAGDPESSVLGVAPDATLLVYRVLGPGGQGWTEWTLEALDKVYEDGCDVVNMSLGVDLNDPTFVTSLAVNNLILAYDIVFAIAAGNAGPESATVGAPGSSSLAITVANGMLPYEDHNFRITGSPEVYMRLLTCDNETEFEYRSSRTYIKNSYTTPRGSVDEIGMTGYRIIPLIETDPFADTTEFSYYAWPAGYTSFLLGKGTEEQFKAREADIKGNIVLVARGLAFVETAALAKKYGAGGVIVLDYPGGGSIPYGMYEVSDDYVPLFLMMDAWDGTTNSNANGYGRLSEWMSLINGKPMTAIDISTNTKTPNPVSLNSTSSRGPVSSTMDIKPDVTAPGTNILSSVPYYMTSGDKANPEADGAYDGALMSMSGTSMASPHIAGVAALMLQHSRENTLNWTAAEIKARMMNTADPISGVFSVYEVGAGFVNPVKAVGAEAYITVEYDDVYISDGYSLVSEPGEMSSLNFRSLKVGQEEDQSVTINASISNTGAAKAFNITYEKNYAGFQSIKASNPIANLVKWNNSGVGITFGSDTINVGANDTAEFEIAASAPANIAADLVGIYEGYVVLTNAVDASETYRLPFALVLRPDSQMGPMFMSHPVTTTSGAFIEDYTVKAYFDDTHSYDSYFSTLYYCIGEPAYEMYFAVAPGDTRDDEISDGNKWIGQLISPIDVRDSEPGVLYKYPDVIGPAYFRYTENNDLEAAIFEPGHYKIIALVFTPFGVEYYPMDFYVDNDVPELTVNGLTGDTYVYSGPTRDEAVITGNIYDEGLEYLRNNNIQYKIYEPNDIHGPDADQALNAIFAKAEGGNDGYIQADIQPNGDFELVLTGLDAAGVTNVELYWLDHFAVANYEWMFVDMAMDFEPGMACMMKVFGYPFAFYGANMGHKTVTVRHTGPAMTMSGQTATLNPGETAGLSAALNTEALDAGYGRSFEWSSSDERVAVVDENGVVTPVDWGTAVITASSSNPGGGKIYASCKVHATGVNDGVWFYDFSQIWYGTYEYADYNTDSATKDNPYFGKSGSPYTTYDGKWNYYSKIPMLWDNKGEETQNGVGDRMVTLYSAYSIDTMDYNGEGWVPYKDSDVRAFLNGEFLDTAFTGAERGAIPSFTVTNGKYGADGGLISEEQIENQSVYLPWGIKADSDSKFANCVFWTAGNEPHFDFSQKGASNWKNHKRTRNIGNVQWTTYYLRSPAEEADNVLAVKGYEGDVRALSDWSYSGEALSWYETAAIGNWTESEVGVGVVPVTKLDMGSIVFAHPIADEDITDWGSMAGYYRGDGFLYMRIDESSAYKLTVLGGNNGEDVGTLGGITGEARSIEQGERLLLPGVTSSVSGGDYRIAYKVAGYKDGKRTVLDYGEFTTADAVRNLSTTTDKLDTGDYMVYVYLLKEGGFSSNEAGVVYSFPLSVVEPGSELTRLDVSVSTPTIVSTLPAYLNITVAGAPQGVNLKAYLEVDGELLHETAVTNGAGRMYIPAAPNVDVDTDYRLIVKGDGCEGECGINVVYYNTDIWVATPFEGGSGYLNIQFNAPISSKTNFVKSVTIGGAAYNATVENKNTLVVNGVAYESLEAGTKIVIAGVKYQELFPSYSFTFTVYR